MTERPPRAFFVHLQKTGGTSVVRCLKQFYAADEVYPDDSRGQDLVFAKTVVGDLLALTDAERRRIRLFTPHHPAWVADVVAPEAVTFTVVREPVGRTLSHLRRMSVNLGLGLETLWGDDDIRSALTDYQTKFLCEPGPEPEPSGGSVGLDAAAGREAVEKAVRLQVATGVTSSFDVGPIHAEQAISRLNGLSVVGVTDGLARFSERLSERLGVRLGHPPRVNVGPAGRDGSDELVESIRRHVSFDRIVHEHAAALAERE